MRRLIASFLVLAALAGARPAHADGDITKARKLFAEGVRLYQNGDWEGARRLFREADAEHHAPAAVYNLGLAEEKLGHPQAAIDAYEAYLAETGDAGDFSSASVTAIAQLKAHSTKLRVESKPAGARVFLDGTPIADPTPVTVLVGAGHHVVVAQGDDWRSERDLEAKGGGENLVVALEPPAAPPPVATVATPPTPPPIEPAHLERPALPPPPPPAPDEIVWGAAFAFVPAYLLGVTTANANNSKPAVTIVAGPVLELGYALTERFEFLGRAFAGLGPDGKPSYSYMGGPGLSFNVASWLWVGASFIGGELETKAGNPKVRYGTDVVFGALAEVNVIVLKKPSGEWLAGLQPALLLTEMRNDNTTFFFPVTFGYRGY